MYVVIYYAVSAVLELIYILWQSFGYELSVSEIESSVMNGSYALGVIAAIISLWIYLAIGKFRKRPLEKTIDNDKSAPMVNIMAVCLAFGARLAVTAYYHFSQSIELLKKSIDDAAAITPQLTGLGQLIIAMFAIVVIAPLFEEVLFRGIVMGELRGVMRPWAAIGFQALLFGAAHAVLFQSIFAFVMGILLGIVYYKTRSIVTSAVCHSAFNLSVVFSHSELTQWSAAVMLVFGVLLIISSIVYIVKGM